MANIYGVSWFADWTTEFCAESNITRNVWQIIIVCSKNDVIESIGYILERHIGIVCVN